MVLENRDPANLRRTWIIAAALGMIGFVIGVVGGYLGHFFGVDNLIVHVASNSDESPFERTYQAMAQIAVAETSAANCDGTADLQEIVKNEKRLTDLLESSEHGTGLTPPLDLARAIVAYRSAAVASLRHDKQKFDSAVSQEAVFLKAAGWVDTSHEHLGAVVRDLDGCASRNAVQDIK